MRKIPVWIVLGNVVGSLLLLFSLGCAGVQKPTPEQLANADYGSYPADYKEITTQYISNILIEPYSAVFSNWRGPSKGWYGNYQGSFFGYRVCVSVNAKNRMGGYTGSKLHFVVINNGRVIVHDGGDYREGTMGEQWAYERCSGI